MHFVIQENLPKIVEYLVINDADILKAIDVGDGVITCACLKGLTDSVSYLLNAATADKRREIEADELLGCYFVQEKSDYGTGLEQWRAGYQKRVQNYIPVPCTACQYDVFADVNQNGRVLGLVDK